MEYSVTPHNFEDPKIIDMISQNLTTKTKEEIRNHLHEHFPIKNEAYPNYYGKNFFTRVFLKKKRKPKKINKKINKKEN